MNTATPLPTYSSVRYSLALNQSMHSNSFPSCFFPGTFLIFFLFCLFLFSFFSGGGGGGGRDFPFFFSQFDVHSTDFAETNVRFISDDAQFCVYLNHCTTKCFQFTAVHHAARLRVLHRRKQLHSTKCSVRLSLLSTTV